MNSIVLSVIVVGGAGLIIGLLLSIAGKKFEVKSDPRLDQVREALPGNNCGGCGYPGCDGAAAAVVEGTATVSVCPVGGAAVEAKIAKVMGQEVSDTGRKVAFVKCAGSCDKTKKDYEYSGIQDCTMMAFVPNGGPKHCNFGCLGYGSCVKVCQFDAIHVIDGVAVVDREACKGCGACSRVCPNHLIEMIPYEGTSILVRCSSQDRGKEVMNGCDIGCISCRKCEKNCPTQAITLEGNVPVIDYDKCINCGTCMEGCPRGCIISVKE